MDTLNSGTDLLENVQTYGTKSAEIHILSPGQLRKLIESASDRLLPYIVIGAFAGLRGAEIQRLDLSEIDLEDGFVAVKVVRTDGRWLCEAKDGRGRRWES